MMVLWVLGKRGNLKMSLCAPGNCDEHFFNTLPDYITYLLYHRAATIGQIGQLIE